MIRLNVPFRAGWRQVCLLLVMLLSSSFSASTAAIDGSAAEQAAMTRVTRGGRHFYLTNASYPSSQALAACATGYHMASFWEIIDPSALTYDFNHPAAHTKADSGQGPPSGWYGRVRTGTDNSTSSTAGIGNCSTWTSTAATDSGVFVRLSRSWEAPPTEIGGVWDVTVFACNVTGPVWCTGEFHLVYLPLVNR